LIFQITLCQRSKKSFRRSSYTTKEIAMNLKSITQEVCTISKEVGIFILEECKKINVSDIEIKSQNSLVTYVDKTAEKMIINFLGKLIPESGFIAEEGTSDKKGDIYNWVIDPLDGTTNFIHAIPCYIRTQS
jgi:myo-inositol-1(or 4)-monophosphatase